MRYTPLKVRRVLAVDPMTKGFGFALLEGRSTLVDWGTREARGDKASTCVRKVAELLGRYRPDFLVLEDHRAPSSVRCVRVRQLLQRIQNEAAKQRIRVRLVSRVRVRATFERRGARTKEQVAQAIAGNFPEVAPYLPRPRKPWMTEDDRMSVFDALALTLVLRDQREPADRAA